MLRHRYLLLSLILCSSSAQALQIMMIRDDCWFEAAGTTEATAEVQLVGLTARQAADTLTRRVGGRIEASPQGLVIRQSSMGDVAIQVVPGPPAKVPLGPAEPTLHIRPLHTINHAQALKLKSSLVALKAAGARSPQPDLPFAPRITVGRTHAHFASEVSGLPEVSVMKLLDAEIASKQSGKPVIFRYLLGSLGDLNPDESRWTSSLYEGIVVGTIPANREGLMPLLVEGDSVVYHNRALQGTVVLGNNNPGLANSNIMQAMDNKFIEYRLWNQGSPGAMPESVSLRDLHRPNEDIRSLVHRLNAKFPEGWVLKGTQDVNTGNFVVTSKLDLVELHNSYLRNKASFDREFDRLKKVYADRNIDDLIEAVQKLPDYLGWKIDDMIKFPAEAFAQKMVDLVAEFRVEIVGGKVLASGSTVDRYWYFEGERPKPTPEQIRMVEEFAHSIVSRLPAEIRGSPWGLDVAIIRVRDSQGKIHFKCVLIEGNSGGCSGFLADTRESVIALNNLLRDYPRQVAEGRVYKPVLTDEQQMRWLDEHFKAWGTPPAEFYKDFKFGANRITRADAKTEITPPDKYSVRATRIRAATEADLHRLVQIEKEAFEGNPHAMNEAAYLESLHDPEQRVYVIEGPEGILGSAVLIFDDKAQKVTIESVAVAKEARGRRLGETLMTGVMDLTKPRAARGYALQVEATNEPAKKLYLKLGFKVSQQKPDFYGTGHHGLEMELSPTPITDADVERFLNDNHACP